MATTKTLIGFFQTCLPRWKAGWMDGCKLKFSIEVDSSSSYIYTKSKKYLNLRVKSSRPVFRMSLHEIKYRQERSFAEAKKSELSRSDKKNLLY